MTPETLLVPLIHTKVLNHAVNFEPNRERLAPVGEPWLGAVFEAGGGIGFAVGSRHERVYATPYVQYHDNEESRLRYFETTFSGRAKELVDGWSWRMAGAKAARLVTTFGDYAPSRADIGAAFTLWLEDNNRHNRLQISTFIKAADRTPVEMSVYLALLDESEFLAGVLDARGGVYSYKGDNGRRDYPVLVVTSKNKVLLKALEARFGGRVGASSGSDMDKSFDELVSASWRCNDPEVIQAVYNQANSHLRFPQKVQYPI